MNFVSTDPAVVGEITGADGRGNGADWPGDGADAGIDAFADAVETGVVSAGSSLTKRPRSLRPRSFNPLLFSCSGIMTRLRTNHLSVKNKPKLRWFEMSE